MGGTPQARLSPNEDGRPSLSGIENTRARRRQIAARWLRSGSTESTALAARSTSNLASVRARGARQRASMPAETTDSTKGSAHQSEKATLAPSVEGERPNSSVVDV